MTAAMRNAANSRVCTSPSWLSRIRQCRDKEGSKDRSSDGPSAAKNSYQEEIDCPVNTKAVNAHERDVMSKKTSCERTENSA